MDDIELSIGASPDIGRLYKVGKSFSRDTPILALTSLRGLGSVFCNALDRSLLGEQLDKKIKSLGDRGMLKPAARRSLRTLQHHGNIAAHPEDFAYEEHDFGAMAIEALEAARCLAEEVYNLRQESVPDYVVVEVESAALAEMCARAMLDRDEDAMNQAGEYFKEKATHATKNDYAMRSDGYGISARNDINQAMFWFRQGAAANNPNGLYQYGLYTANDRESDEAQRKYGQSQISRAAEAGHVEALVYVAQSSLEGTGIFVEDLVYARERFELAAEQGHPAALAQLGGIYAQGLGCEIDHDKAAGFTMRAAELGFPQGQYNLYVICQAGVGVPKDMDKAIKWLIEAAAQDYPKAVFALACAIYAEIVPGRTRVDAVPEYERATVYPEFRARAALAIAQILGSPDGPIANLARAGHFAQQCFEAISAHGDPFDLRAECLAISKRTVSRLRQQISGKGPDASLNGGDVMVCTLFDREGIPVPNAEVRNSKVALKLYDLGRDSPEKGRDFLIREACLTTPKHPALVSVPRLAPTPFRVSGPKQKPNAPCQCGSGLKFKKCPCQEK